jgi:LacI family transcriptional regulator
LGIGKGRFWTMSIDEETKVGARKRAATILDVAEAAGVAVGTVSRYLNGLPVRNANRHPIEDAIRELGYRRSSIAVSLKTQTTGIVGLMIPGYSEFHASLHVALTRRLQQSGRALICYSHDRDPTSIARGLEFFAEHRVDAVIIDGDEGARPVLQRSIEDGLIVVLYDHDLPGIPADRVFMENLKSSKRLVDHLAELGHRRIATVHARRLPPGSPWPWYSRPRGLRRAGLLDRGGRICRYPRPDESAGTSDRSVLRQLQHDDRRIALAA